ncbi:MAG: Hpt domain-containing protein, partial [Rhodospirillales bacterium]|nr:Hpt domain-containing protein [Rhodospirillales bacterium]
MDDLIAEFITETSESLGTLDLDLIKLEQNPNDAALLGNIFRLMHTIKGTCGFLGLPRLEKVAHHAENVLGRFRDGDLEVTPAYVSLILESIDRIKFIVESIEQTSAEPDGDDAELIERLDRVFEGREEDGAAETVKEITPQESLDMVVAAARKQLEEEQQESSMEEEPHESSEESGETEKSAAPPPAAAKTKPAASPAPAPAKTDTSAAQG